MLPESVPLKFTTTSEEPRRIFAALQRRAEAGETAAQVELGIDLVKGQDGLRQNATLGLKYLEAAANKGDGSANAELAGYWVARDRSLAVPYYQAAVQAGHEPSIFGYAQELAFTGFPGKDVEQGTQEAIQILQPLANRGNRIAEGWIQYFKNKHFLKEENRTIPGLRKLREIITTYEDLPRYKVVSETQLLGYLADLGDMEGVEWQFDRAMKANNEANITTWLPKLVETGSAKGLYNQGVAKVKGIYEYETDVAGGLEDIETAAGQGFIPAMQDLARTYRGGWHGKEQNLETARAWATKVKTAGETEWAETFLSGLDALEARANQEIAIDGKVDGLDKETFDYLKYIQEVTTYTNMPNVTFSSLFSKIWHNAYFSAAEEDLVSEMTQQNSLEVTNEEGNLLTFTKVPGAGDHASFQSIFPTPFPASDPNYPLNFWGKAVTGGPTLYFVQNSGVQDQARDTFLRALYQQITQLVQNIQQTNNNYPLVQFNNDLVNRAKAMEPAQGREFAKMVDAMIRDDIQATPALLNMFSSLNTFAQSPLPEDNS